MLVASVLALALATNSSVPEPRLDAAGFERLRREILPESSERWLSVPWYTDLLAARDVAAGLNRPLFLWAMNGHPIGAS